MEESKLINIMIPVYKEDIGSKGFNTVSLGGEIEGKDYLDLVNIAPEKISQAADHAVELLTNKELRDQYAEENFNLGKEHYSMNALRELLVDLMQD